MVLMRAKWVTFGPKICNFWGFCSVQSLQSSYLGTSIEHINELLWVDEFVLMEYEYIYGRWPLGAPKSQEVKLGRVLIIIFFLHDFEFFFAFLSEKIGLFEEKTPIFTIFNHFVARSRPWRVLDDFSDQSQFSRAQMYRFHSIFDGYTQFGGIGVKKTSHFLI